MLLVLFIPCSAELLVTQLIAHSLLNLLSNSSFVYAFWITLCNAFGPLFREELVYMMFLLLLEL